MRKNMCENVCEKHAEDYSCVGASHQSENLHSLIFFTFDFATFCENLSCIKNHVRVCTVVNLFFILFFFFFFEKPEEQPD